MSPPESTKAMARGIQFTFKATIQPLPRLQSHLPRESLSPPAPAASPARPCPAIRGTRPVPAPHRRARPAPPPAPPAPGPLLAAPAPRTASPPRSAFTMRPGVPGPLWPLPWGALAWAVGFVGVVGSGDPAPGEWGCGEGCVVTTHVVCRLGDWSPACPGTGQSQVGKDPCQHVLSA